MTPKFNALDEATATTNQLFYGDGPQPKPIQLRDAMYVREIIIRALTEAFEAGKRAS